MKERLRDGDRRQGAPAPACMVEYESWFGTGKG